MAGEKYPPGCAWRRCVAEWTAGTAGATHCPDQTKCPLELPPEAVDNAQMSPWTSLMAKDQRTLIENGLQTLTTREQLMIRLRSLEERPQA